MKKVVDFYKRLSIKEKLFYFFSFVLFLLVIVPSYMTASRYFITSANEFYLNAKEFFFTSDEINGTNHEIISWDGISTYNLTFSVTNAKSNLNWTKENISYDINVTCPNNFICNGSTNNLLTSSNSVSSSNTHTIIVNPNGSTYNVGDRVTVTISVSSTSPYSKTLTSTYTLVVNRAKVNYYINDVANREYLDLIIENQLSTRNLIINIDNTRFNIDTSNYYVKNGTKTVSGTNNIIDSLTFNALSNNVYAFRLYKNDVTQNYTNTTLITVGDAS